MGTELIGINEVKRMFEKVGKAPAKVMTKAVKSAATLVKNNARDNAPEETGSLKRGINLRAEKRRTGKKVYDIGFYGKSGKGLEYIGHSRHSKDKNGNPKRSFYPASQEFGWVKQNGQKEPGKKFLRNAIDKQRGKIEEIIIETMGEELDKLR